MPSLLAVTTSVVWLGCVAVGLTGLYWLPAPPPPASRKVTPVEAKLIHVELSEQAAAVPSTPAAAARASPVVAATDQPPAPPMIATPSAVAFALPTTAPLLLAAPSHAMPPSSEASHSAAVEHLSYASVQGEQPRPEYPLEAKIAHQEGTVLIRFTIGEDGRVASADVLQPSPFPLLNDSALRCVREEWRFAPGPLRVCDIPIEFKLVQR
jgi:protein TonB